MYLHSPWESVVSNLTEMLLILFGFAFLKVPFSWWFFLVGWFFGVLLVSLFVVFWGFFVVVLFCFIFLVRNRCRLRKTSHRLVVERKEKGKNSLSSFFLNSPENSGHSTLEPKLPFVFQ